MSRFFIGSLALLLSLSLILPGVAREATPEPQSPAPDQLFDVDLNLPEIGITVTGIGMTVSPAATTAGRHLVTLTGDVPDGVLITFVQLPAGKTLDDLLAAYAPASPQPPGAIDWIYQTYSPGGVGVFATGQRAQVILDLIPGDYGIAVAGPNVREQPQALTVTGAATSTPVDLAANMALTMTGSAKDGGPFRVEGTLTTGPQVLRVNNESGEIHHLQILHAPEPISQQQAQKLFAPGTTEQPDFSGWSGAAFAGTQSPGTSQWLALDLAPGYYVVACFLVDLTTELSHTALGEIDVIVVQDAATPVASPAA